MEWSAFEDLKKSFKKETFEEKIEEERCKECGELSVVIEDGHKVCRSCGIDNGMYIETTQEWNNYSNDDGKKDNSRCGMTNDMTTNSLGTVLIGGGNQSFKRVHTWNSIDSSTRSSLNTLNKIEKFTRNHNIPKSIIQRTNQIYIMITENKIKRGKIKNGLLAAIMLYVCKKHSIHKTSTEIANIFKLSEKKMIQGIKQFHEYLYEVGIDRFKEDQPTTYKDYIYSYCHKLELYDELIIKKIIACAKIANELGLNLHNTPSSIAVGCIFFVFEELKISISKTEIEHICGPSIVTITKTYKEMIPYKKIFQHIIHKLKIKVKSKYVDSRE